VIGSGPGNTSLELGQRGGASGGGGKSNTKKLRRWHEKDVRDISNTKTRLAQKEIIALSASDVRLGRAQINENSVGL
jgi:hypothetical protein